MEGLAWEPMLAVAKVPSPKQMWKGAKATVRTDVSAVRPTCYAARRPRLSTAREN
jgi:hypothetical protein